MTRTYWVGLAAAAVLAIIAAVVLSRPHDAVTADVAPTAQSEVAAPVLPGYARSAQLACEQKAHANPALTKAATSSAAIRSYCVCFADKSGALITAADAAYIEANKTLPPNFQARIAPAISSCAAANGLNIRP